MNEVLEYLLKVGISLLVVLVLLYFALPVILRGRLQRLKAKNLKLEEVLPLGKDMFFVCVRIKEKKFYLLISPNYAKVLYEESVNDSHS
ncbi:hypothetical protein [Aquifex aeolicus]|uniref:hypothetical protein n=1 Tax=Aquifex aeolicus TaxID=63363 RepID=UPI000314A193|nr:hypothetical protein [Aquifex aeolicus]